MYRLCCFVALALTVLGCSSPPRTGAAPQAQASPTSEWDGIVAAAKREGKIVIQGPQGTDARDALVEGFQRKYPDIQVEFTGMAGNEVAPKIVNEQAANQHFTDVLVTGATTVITALQPADVVAPVPDYLVGPNVKDPSVWRGGTFSYADEAGRYSLVFSAYAKEGFAYNPTIVSPGEITSYRDLLAPKWKGKMAMRNPQGAGGGLGVVTYFYASDSLGKDFIRDFFNQDVTLSNDDRQLLDWVAHGQYPIVFGASNVLSNEYVERGLPLALMDAQKIKEGSFMTAGNGCVAVVKDPPHPNATKVYLDWLLSKDGQTDWVKAIGFASLRRDVPTDNVDPVMVPKDGVDYVDMTQERYVKLRGEVTSYLETVLPPR